MIGLAFGSSVTEAERTRCRGPAGPPVAWMPTLDSVEAYARGILRAGDLCLTLGAGDIDTVGRRLVAAQ